MSILTKYVIKQLLGSFFIGLGGFLIFVSLELLYQLSDIIVRYRVGIDKLFLLIFYNLPYFIVLGIPVGVLLAIFWTLSRMRTDNELMAMQTHGISLKSIVLPFVLVALILSGCVYVLNDYLVPEANRKASEALARYVYRRPEVTLRENAFMEDGMGRYLYIKRVNTETGVLQDVLLYEIADRVTRVTSARRAIREGNDWIMQDGRIYEVDDTGFLRLDISFETLELQFEHSIDEYIRTTKSPREMTSAELRERIESFRRIGVNTASLEVSLQEKYSLSIAPLVIVLLGVPVSVLVNLKSKSWSVILTFVLVVIYQGSGAWLSALGKEYRITPWLAPWIPNIVFTAIGILAYLMIDTKVSYRLSETLVRVFRISVILLVVTIPALFVFSADVKVQGGNVAGTAREILLSDGVSFSYTAKEYWITVEADNASVLMKDGEPASISFWGNAKLAIENHVIEADRLLIDLERLFFESLEVYTSAEVPIPTVEDETKREETLFFVYGKHLEAPIDEDATLVLSKGYLTTCDVSKDPHYVFRVSETEVVPEEYIVVKNLIMYIGRVPVFYLPIYRFPLDDPERRPFSVDFSSIGEAKTTLTLRYLDIDWLVLKVVWERNWATTEEDVAIGASIDTRLGEIDSLGFTGERIQGDEYIMDYGGYLLLRPSTSLGRIEVGGMHLQGVAAEELKIPFTTFSYGLNTKPKTPALLSVFDVKDRLESESVSHAHLSYKTPAGAKLIADFSAHYAHFDDDYLWTVNMRQLNLPANISIETERFSLRSERFASNALIGRRYIESSAASGILYDLRASASLLSTRISYGAFSFSISSLSVEILADAESMDELLKVDSIEDFLLSAKNYELKFMGFQTRGDIESTFDASPRRITVVMPFDKNRIGKNMFVLSAFSERLKIEGKYALDYDSDVDSDSEKELFWIDPIKGAYRGWLSVDLEADFRLRYNGSWTFTADKLQIYKDIEIIKTRFWDFSYTSILTPKYEIALLLSSSSEESEITKSWIGVVSKNKFSFNPGEYLQTSIEYNPEIGYDLLEMGLDIRHPGKYSYSARTGLLNVSYVVDLDYEVLFSDPGSMEWLGDGTFSTDGKAEILFVEFAHTSKTELKKRAFEEGWDTKEFLLSRPSKTEASVSFSMGFFSHKSQSTYDWVEGVWGDIVNTERLTLQFERIEYSLGVDWTYDPADDAERELKNISLTTAFSFEDSFKISAKFSYPYKRGNTEYLERFRIEVGELRVWNYFKWKSATIDFMTDQRLIDKSHEAYTKYFSTTDKEARFALFSVTDMEFGSISLGALYFATEHINDEGFSLSLGINRLRIDGVQYIGGSTASVRDHGFSVEYISRTDRTAVIMSLNELGLSLPLDDEIPFVLHRMTLNIGTADNDNYLEIGTYSGLLDDLNTSISKARPLFFDLHCMALEFFARIRFGEGVTISNAIESVGFKYYIKAFPDRYLTIGFYRGDLFFRFRF
ncbi:MAG: Permease YjgP/YjgQ family protein [Thermotogales bacterium 46_20]|nr:MAG: Permease YjgP/YjgQ family protein [Thermotogales bacterium 46_20]